MLDFIVFYHVEVLYNSEFIDVFFKIIDKYRIFHTLCIKLILCLLPSVNITVIFFFF